MKTTLYHQLLSMYDSCQDRIKTEPTSRLKARSAEICNLLQSVMYPKLLEKEMLIDIRRRVAELIENPDSCGNHSQFLTEAGSQDF